MKASTPQRKRKLVKEPDLDPKQRNIKEFLLRKNQPKIKNSKVSQETGNMEKNNQGATCGPLLGVTDCRAPQSPSSRSPGPSTEVRGRLWAARGRKRTNKALELWMSRQQNRNSEKEKTGPSGSQCEREE